MTSSQFGRKLNPYRRLRDPLGIKAIRQSVTVTNNPSTIDQNQQLLVRFPNLGAYDVIVPGSVRLAFEISLTSTDVKRSVVQNLGRAIVKKLTIRISGNELMSVDDSDVFHTYSDLWLTKQERKNAHYQGIDESANQNVTRLRIDAGDKDVAKAEDKAISDAFGARYHIPLDFELLEGHMPFYQSALGDRLEYEVTFNDYGRVLKAAADKKGTYKIENIYLEFEMVTRARARARARTHDPQSVRGPHRYPVRARPPPQKDICEQERHALERKSQRSCTEYERDPDAVRRP